MVLPKSPRTGGQTDHLPSEARRTRGRVGDRNINALGYWDVVSDGETPLWPLLAADAAEVYSCSAPSQRRNAAARRESARALIGRGTTACR